MQRALTKLLVERERLLARSERQREAIAVAFGNLGGPAALIDRGIRFGRFLRSHPVAVAGLIAGMVVLRARSVLGMVARGISVWQLVRRVRALARLLDR